MTGHAQWSLQKAWHGQSGDWYRKDNMASWVAITEGMTWPLASSVIGIERMTWPIKWPLQRECLWTVDSWGADIERMTGPVEWITWPGEWPVQKRWHSLFSVQCSVAITERMTWPVEWLVQNRWHCQLNGHSRDNYMASLVAIAKRIIWPVKWPVQKIPHIGRHWNS